MAEGLSASEVGKQIREHAKHADPHERRDRLISIIEAVLLSMVALLAAWSGYARQVGHAIAGGDRSSVGPSDRVESRRCRRRRVAQLRLVHPR
jgi:hypothetical protein